MILIAIAVTGILSYVALIVILGFAEGYYA